MFVQINDAYAALRRRLERRRPPTRALARYARKPKVTGRTVYGQYPGTHRASAIRPSYSHPALRAERIVRAATVPAHRSPAPVRRRRAPAARPRDASPARDIRAVGRAVVLCKIPTINAAVTAWFNDPAHGARSHRAGGNDPHAPHRREHVYLPNIGWCWVTDEHPKVVI